MEELGSLFVALALLILLAVTSMRYGVDSRDGFRGRRGDLAPRGIVWDAPPRTENVAEAAPRLEAVRPVSEPAACGLEPCAA